MGMGWFLLKLMVYGIPISVPLDFYMPGLLVEFMNTLYTKCRYFFSAGLSWKTHTCTSVCLVMALPQNTLDVLYFVYLRFLYLPVCMCLCKSSCSTHILLLLSAAVVILLLFTGSKIWMWFSICKVAKTVEAKTSYDWHTVVKCFRIFLVYYIVNCNWHCLVCVTGKIQYEKVFLLTF